MKKLLRITLPTLHNKQKQIFNCKDKRILINAGRQAGKTFLLAAKAIYKAQQGKKVLYIAPTSGQTQTFWDYIIEWLSDAISINLVKVNNTTKTILFKSGGRIEARTAYKPDNLRSGNADYIILDEFAYMHEDVWKKVCQPMLLANNGTAVFISTPNMRNHFYYLYLKALEDEYWKVFTFSSLDNPHLSEKALEMLAKDMTDIDYRQEILAEFVPGEGQIFRISEDNFYFPSWGELSPKLFEEHKGHRIVAGLDWGQKNDYTVLSIGCANCNKEIHLERTNKIEYSLQRDIIKAVLDNFEYVELLAEENSIGLPNIEQLRKDGVPVNGYRMTNSSKASLVQQLRLALFQKDWLFLDNEQGKRELEAYEMKVTPAGNRTYNAPTGFHDDINIARMLMLHQANTGRHTLV